MTADTVHLGFEVPTGEPVEIPIAHTAVTGQTRLSGKTTTLEALIARSSRRALAFITKRGEDCLTSGREIPAYFRHESGWQFVSSILEATLREKLKFERSWIMKVSRGTSTLADVLHNVERSLQTARGLNESVLTTLRAYLELVVPQIHSRSWAPGIDLRPGLNVMDLRDLRFEMQALVVRSSLEWVYEKERGVVVVIPEAWEMIPQQRSSPVKLAAEQLIRKGGASQNWVWMDSQDLAGIHKDVLRSVSVWILGVQREANEVSRMLEHIPPPRPTAADVMKLGLGEFFVSYGKQLKKAYVQPARMQNDTAHKVAIGQTSASVSAVRAVARATAKATTEEDPMWKEKYETLQARYSDLERRFSDLQKRYEDLSSVERGRKVAERERRRGESAETVPSLAPDGAADLDKIYAHVRERLLAEPSLVVIAVRQPELVVQRTRRTVEVDGSSMLGRVTRLVVEHLLDKPTSQDQVFDELVRRGLNAKTPKVRVWEPLTKLTQMGILRKEPDGWVLAPGAVVGEQSVTGG